MNEKIALTAPSRELELPAYDGTIKPGMLLEEKSDGTVQKQSTAGGFFEMMVAQEDALQGRTKDDLYSTGDPVSIFIPNKGGKFQGMCLAGINYTVGMQVFPDNAGRFRSTTGTPKQCAAVVYEAKDLSGSGAVDALVKLRAL